MVEARRSDNVVVDTVKEETIIIDVVAVPVDTRVCDKEREKIEKGSLLKGEIAKLWQMKKVTVISIAVGALGVIATEFEKYIESLGSEIRTEHCSEISIVRNS